MFSNGVRFFKSESVVQNQIVKEYIYFLNCTPIHLHIILTSKLHLKVVSVNHLTISYPRMTRFYQL